MFVHDRILFTAQRSLYLHFKGLTMKSYHTTNGYKARRFIFTLIGATLLISTSVLLMLAYFDVLIK